MVLVADGEACWALAGGVSGEVGGGSRCSAGVVETSGRPK